MTTSGGVTNEPALNGLNPASFGSLGWTVDPMVCASSAQISPGKVFLNQFTATVTGPIGHLLYNVATAGVTLTAGQCGLAVYDNGEAAANVLTLLGQTADQSTAWLTGGYLDTALLASVNVVQGDSYYVGWLANGTTVPFFSRGGNMAALLTNINQSSGGLVRAGMTVAGSLTAFPTTIAYAGMNNAGLSYCAVAVP